MINQIFGVYKVLEIDYETSQKKSKRYWKCECQKCGSIVPVRTDGLKRLPKGCPNCRYNNNYIGQKFGRLTVLDRNHTDKNGHVYWKCQCECGKITIVSGSNLKEEKIKSCGCLHSEIVSSLGLIDLTGQKFNHLTVIKRANDIGERAAWLCQCDCGNTTVVQGNNLKIGHTTSCGCIRSKGEYKIRQLLNQLQYTYYTEYKFKNLPGRRYDFYLPDYNICIEYDGKQHFNFVGTWHQTQEEFNEAIRRDKEKTEYCLNNNIKLIRIPYYDYEKLNKEYLAGAIASVMEEADGLEEEV